jgi:phospholipid/cholesterol/gamma-HCH transport system substrate-binding protein
MKSRGTEFAVGLFAIVGLGVIVFMSLQVNRHQSIGRSSHQYHATFDSVSGLIPKIPVEVSGIVSGYVDTIELIDNKARITIRLDKKVKVYEDAALLIRDRGVLGDRYVVLTPGFSEKPEIPDGGEIKFTQSQSDLEKLTRTLADTAVTLKELLQSDDPQGALGHTITNLRNLTEKIDTMIGDNRDNVSAIMENIRSLTNQINHISLENREQIRTLIANLNEITKKINDGEGSLGKLINDDTTVNNLNTTLEGVNTTLGLFSRVQLKFRYRGEYLLSSNDVQNLFGIIISPGPDKYILIELNSSPKGATNVTDTIINSGGTTTTTQTIQTTTGITFTLMFAKRFWDATLRVGLIRNQGGVGLDYHFFKDALVLSGEMFDLSRPNNRPIMRLYGTLFLYRHLLLTGGVDDVLNQAGPINPFVGLGLQFTDNDFKALLPVLRGSSGM